MLKYLTVKLRDGKTLRFIMLIGTLVEAPMCLWELWTWDSRDTTVLCC